MGALLDGTGKWEKHLTPLITLFVRWKASANLLLPSLS
jgi:hypothetical protein